MKRKLLLLSLTLLLFSCGETKPEEVSETASTTTTTILTKTVERTVNIVVLASESTETMAEIELKVNTAASLARAYGGGTFVYESDGDYSWISENVDTSQKKQLSGDKWEKDDMVFMYRVYQLEVVAEVPMDDPVSVTVTDTYDIYSIPDYSIELFTMAIQKAMKEAGLNDKEEVTGIAYITGASVDISPMEYDVELTVDYDFYFH